MAQHAQALLSGCRGRLRVDGYTGFGRLYEANTKTGITAPLIEVAHSSQARRKPYEIHVRGAHRPLWRALEIFGTLFAMEADVRGQNAL